MPHPVLQFQILSSNPDATSRFYSELFGWKMDADNAFGYRRIDTGVQEGIQGGIWPAPPRSPVFTQLFIGVEDVNASVQAAEHLGARLLVPPTHLPEGDEMAVLQDPMGMAFAVWRVGKNSA